MSAPKARHGNWISTLPETHAPQQIAPSFDHLVGAGKGDLAMRPAHFRSTPNNGHCQTAKHVRRCHKQSLPMAGQTGAATLRLHRANEIGATPHKDTSAQKYEAEREPFHMTLGHKTLELKFHYCWPPVTNQVATYLMHDHRHHRRQRVTNRGDRIVANVVKGERIHSAVSSVSNHGVPRHFVSN
jgi:hypothetical protein